MRKNLTSQLIPLLLLFTLLLAACNNADSNESVESQPEQVVTTAPETTEAESAEVESTDVESAEAESTEAEPAEAGSEDTALTDLLATGAPTRTPAPTTTPGLLVREVSRATEEMDLNEESFLGMNADDWIILGISVFVILAGYLGGAWLIRRILPRLVRRTSAELDDRLLEIAGSGLRWLVVLLALQFVTTRSTVLGAGLKTILGDIYFVLGLGITTRIVWQFVDLTAEYMRLRTTEEGRQDALEPVLNLLVRLARAVIALVSLTVLLAHFGVNVSIIAAALGLGGLALSLAARDTIADIIAGIIILVDRPFRIGDEIRVEGVDTSGDVVIIGLRTTQILTGDNRIVIIPNSTITKNELINYTYPDPRYRIQIHVTITYGTPVETTRLLLHDTVRQVEGVLPDKPVDVLYHEMGDSAMVFRVRWWIESYGDNRKMIDSVNTALQKALDVAGIATAYPVQNLNLQVDPQTVKPTGSDEL